MNQQSLLTIAVFICLLSPVEAGAAQVYQTVDEDGNVVFTDVPPRHDSGVKRVIVSPINIANLGSSAPMVDEVDEIDESAEFSYESADIISPRNDEAVRGNVGNIRVDIDIYPALQDGHAVQLLLDGIAVQTGRNSSFLLDNVDRGTHTLQLEVIDYEGNLLLAGRPTTFHLQRYAIPTAPNQVRTQPINRPVAPPPSARPPAS